jgi:carbon storage regulator
MKNGPAARRATRKSRASSDVSESFRNAKTRKEPKMLVLSRQRDETIMIGDDIEVTVVDIRGDKVRLGINAPKEISVHRKEVYDAIRRENRAAAQVKPEDLSGLGKINPGKTNPNTPGKEDKK